MDIRRASDLCLPLERGESLRTGTLLGVCIAPTAVARISGGEAQNIPYHAGTQVQHLLKGLAQPETSVVIRRVPSEALCHPPRSCGDTFILSTSSKACDNLSHVYLRSNDRFCLYNFYLLVRTRFAPATAV